MSSSEATPDRAPDSEVREKRNDEHAGRYEAELADGSLAVLDYRIESDKILFTHTGTPERHRRQGIAGELTRYALDDAVERGLKLAPHCPYTVWFIRENPEYREHLAEGYRV